MNKIYAKKFSIGLSLSISVEEYERIIDTFGDYICSIYFSPPLGPQFHSREVIAEQLQMKENVEKLLAVIKLFNERGITVDADINMSPLNDDDVESFINFVKEHKEITEVTAIEPYGSKIHAALPHMRMIYSFNNFYHGEEIPSYYDTVVIGRNYLKDCNEMNRIIDQGREVKLLINNGCSHNCGTCKKGSKQCFSTVETNLKSKSVNELYAAQTLFPWELYEVIKRIRKKDRIVFKISNRTSGYSYLYKCLKAYTEFQYIHPYIDEGIHNYALFSRIGPMEHHFSELNYEQIEENKMNFWKSYE